MVAASEMVSQKWSRTYTPPGSSTTSKVFLWLLTEVAKRTMHCLEQSKV